MFENLAEILVARGFKLEPHFDGSSDMLIASGPKFRVRAFEDTFQVGFEETFDRWANSIDYEDKVPKSESALNKVFAIVDTLEKCHYCSSWNTPHKVANRPCCPECYQRKHKNKDPNGKRR